MAYEFNPFTGTLDKVGAAGAGEANTASNQGVGGVGLFKQKTGVDLEFKNINAGSGKLTVTDDVGNNEIDVDVSEGNLDHINIQNIGINTHAQVDTHIADVTNPHSVTKTQVTLGNVENLKVNLTATIAPTVNDDSGAGYSVGSHWIDITGDKAYVCLDSSVGAAIWTETTFGGVPSDTDLDQPWLTNRTGASTIIGGVYLIDPDNDESYIYSNNDRKSQVAVATQITVSLGSARLVKGGVVDVYVTGTINRGEWVHFSTTNGQAKPVISDAPLTGNFGYAIESRTGAGLVAVMIKSTAAASVVASGSSFPSSPFAGEEFILVLGNRNILYRYNGTVWVSKCVNADTDFYINGTDGMDSPEKGFGVNFDAFKTVQYAIDQVPGELSGNVSIYISGETYNEDVVIQGKAYTGNHYIQIVGTVDTILAEVTASGGSMTTIVDSGAGWTVNAYQGKMVRITGGTGVGQICVVKSNTSDTITVAGSWYRSLDTIVTGGGIEGKGVAPNATSTFVVEDWLTTINSQGGVGKQGAINIMHGQKNVQIKHIKLIPNSSSEYCANIFNFAMAEFYGCEMDGNSNGRGPVIQTFSAAYIRSSYCHSASTIGGLYVVKNSIADVRSSWIDSNTGTGVRLDRMSLADILASSIDNNSSHGVYAYRKSYTRFIGGDDQTTINNNGGWGELSSLDSTGDGVSNASYSGNTLGTYSPSAASDPSYNT